MYIFEEQLYPSAYIRRNNKNLKKNDFFYSENEKFSFITVPFDKTEKIVVSFKEKRQRPLITHAKKKK